MPSSFVVVGTVVAVGIITGFLIAYFTKREKFMIAAEPSRCSLDGAGGTRVVDGVAKNLPIVDHEGASQQFPESILFVIKGYNYATTPIIYRDGVEVTPLQYAWDDTIMTYYIRVDGDVTDRWTLETSDYIKPLVSEGDSGIELKVDILRRRGSFNLWTISKE